LRITEDEISSTRSRRPPRWRSPCPCALPGTSTPRPASIPRRSFGRPLDFLRHPDLLGRRHLLRRAGRGGVQQGLIDIRLDLFLGFRGDGDVEALFVVDPDFLDAAVDDQADVVLVLDDELGAPEGMLHPGTAQLMQVHARAQMLDVDFFQHARLAGLFERPIVPLPWISTRCSKR
jgi:hypothetical protein